MTAEDQLAAEAGLHGFSVEKYDRKAKKDFIVDTYWRTEVMRALRYAAAAFVLITASLGSAAAGERQVVGLVETVRLYPGNIVLQGKVDTGADTSSLGVVDMTLFTRGGGDWVRFSLADEASRIATFERPVVRISRVRRAGVATEERPVVRIGICLGSFYKDAEVNLTDRTKMTYRLLIGRLFLGNRFLIDPAASFLTKPACPEAATQ